MGREGLVTSPVLSDPEAPEDAVEEGTGDSLRRRGAEPHPWRQSAGLSLVHLFPNDKD